MLKKVTWINPKTQKWDWTEAKACAEADEEAKDANRGKVDKVVKEDKMAKVVKVAKEDKMAEAVKVAKDLVETARKL